MLLDKIRPYIHKDIFAKVCFFMIPISFVAFILIEVMRDPTSSLGVTAAMASYTVFFIFFALLGWNQNDLFWVTLSKKKKYDEMQLSRRYKVLERSFQLVYLYFVAVVFALVYFKPEFSADFMVTLAVMFFGFGIPSLVAVFYNKVQ